MRTIPGESSWAATFSVETRHRPATTDARTSFCNSDFMSTVPSIRAVRTAVNKPGRLGAHPCLHSRRPFSLESSASIVLRPFASPWLPPVDSRRTRMNCRAIAPDIPMKQLLVLVTCVHIAAEAGSTTAAGKAVAVCIMFVHDPRAKQAATKMVAVPLGSAVVNGGTTNIRRLSGHGLLILLYICQLVARRVLDAGDHNQANAGEPDGPGR